MFNILWRRHAVLYMHQPTQAPHRHVPEHMDERRGRWFGAGAQVEAIRCNLNHLSELIVHRDTLSRFGKYFAKQAIAKEFPGPALDHAAVMFADQSQDPPRWHTFASPGLPVPVIAGFVPDEGH
jgi:hypothetical protein